MTCTCRPRVDDWSPGNVPEERERGVEPVRLHGASNGEKFDRLPFHRSAIPCCRIVSVTYYFPVIVDCASIVFYSVVQSDRLNPITISGTKIRRRRSWRRRKWEKEVWRFYFTLAFMISTGTRGYEMKLKLICKQEKENYTTLLLKSRDLLLKIQIPNQWL